MHNRHNHTHQQNRIMITYPRKLNPWISPAIIIMMHGFDFRNVYVHVCMYRYFDAFMFVMDFIIQSNQSGGLGARQ